MLLALSMFGVFTLSLSGSLSENTAVVDTDLVPYDRRIGALISFLATGTARRHQKLKGILLECMGRHLP